MPCRPPSRGEPEILIKVREGLAGIERSFTGVLERNGIQKDDPVGQPFDPNLHQAMAEQDSEVHAPGTVMQAWTAVLDLERPAAETGDGRGGQGAHRRTAGSGCQTRHDGMRLAGARANAWGMNVLSQNPAIRSCPRRSGPIHPDTYHPMGTSAVLRAAGSPLNGVFDNE